MARGMNDVTLMGNIVRDIDSKTTTGGKEYARFSVAVGNDYKGKDGVTVKQTDFVSCMAWGTTASILKRFAVKGKPILLKGRIKTDKYEKNGETKYNTYVLIHEVILLSFGGGKSNDSGDEDGDTSFDFGNDASAF